RVWKLEQGLERSFFTSSRSKLGKDRRAELRREVEVITYTMAPKKPAVTPKNDKGKGKIKQQETIA
ncbi:hypothetical protein KI387_013530, partial [Taxus chinensis]